MTMMILVCCAKGVGRQTVFAAIIVYDEMLLEQISL